jgi:diguanylate cyclase (GGDEF)-like protein
MYGDIDGFKDLNDTYGHDKGDAVLIAVAQALRATFRETDLVARLGGDEFCVVAEDIDAARLTGRLEGAMASVSREVGLPVAMSHGEVLSGWQGLEEAATLLARADARMYQVKQARRGGLEGGIQS